ncbi:cell wall-associated hydrolase [Lactobacillus pasteurii DSM 23907 = CRBIP 24.76]|uniref:Cell wall-associated hydrolase n=1 Tax=Lactobacillus pasteurii DSM 23907 = CRBIP 24.76 TaxID=1423790 RepID=I7LA14_9LACO|nr:C40 family peptidase [Lactobacillus pasteurii]KRK07936.1 cell wall-associated hydrolase [Lactobacillus pasteurii DSM 23907 = CRBIP 24.76]TDG77899.1 hypothetical protein C5L33_001704 [Lactobacillus pasteurii]CCI84296.1 Cell wall-associated hydrolase [Lactobacillus pasteurii DSM 23907 = CRBIP 24.76]
MNIKSNLVKATAAAALTITGISAINAVKPSTTSHVQAATTQVKINYVPGYGINVWDNYNHGHFTGIRVQHGSLQNVMDTQVDDKGRTWYKIGENQWILAQYTVSPDKKVKSKKSVQAADEAAGIVALAKAQLGSAYVWGGTNPGGFDCSGLVQYVYKNAAGISLGRTTYQQVKSGTSVSMNNLQAGDLLFWGSASAPYHVGIYLGGGKYIHAATPGQGVVIQSLSSYFYPSVAKRVL